MKTNNIFSVLNQPDSDSSDDSKPDKKAKQTKPSQPESKANPNEGSIFSKKKGKAKKNDINKKRAMANAKKDSKGPTQMADDSAPAEDSQAQADPSKPVISDKDAPAEPNANHKTPKDQGTPNQAQRKSSEPVMHQYVDGQLVPINSLDDLKPSPLKPEPAPVTTSLPTNPEFIGFPEQVPKESKYGKIGL